MSLRLKNIPYACPIYDSLAKEVEQIQYILDPDHESIDCKLGFILSSADEIRNICGDLRDTAKDIADYKNQIIQELENELNLLRERLSEKEDEYIGFEEDLYKARQELRRRDSA